jgi:predicted small secreted protein
LPYIEDSLVESLVRMKRSKDTSIDAIPGLVLLCVIGIIFFGHLFLNLILVLFTICVLWVIYVRYSKLTERKQVQVASAVQCVHHVDQKRLNIRNSWIKAERLRGDYVRDAISYYDSIDMQPGAHLSYTPRSRLKRNQLTEAEQVFHHLQTLYEREHLMYQSEIKIQENLAYIRRIEEIRKNIQKTWVNLEKQRIRTGSPKPSAYYNTVAVLPGTYLQYRPSAETKNGQIWETEQIIAQLDTLYECEHMHKEKEYNEHKRKSKVSGIYGGGPYCPYDYNYLKDLYGL